MKNMHVMYVYSIENFATPKSNTRNNHTTNKSEMQTRFFCEIANRKTVTLRQQTQLKPQPY